ncbi:MAG: 3-oxoacyl-[acyl-carrier-protein] synthase III C-terminal domain-containing protein [Cyanobacteriota bacterium]
MTYIISIETENPDYKTEQSNILEFMKKIYPEFLHEKINRLYERSGINYRYSCIPDYNLGVERVLYPNSENLEPFPNIDKRLDIYHTEAKKLTIKTIKKLFNTIEKEKITHLITVSCTGMYAPGLDLEIIEELELNNEMYRTSVNFMGCYAAFHGMKQADYICKSDKKAVVLVVCVELCTLHFMKDLDMNCVTSNAIFGDGCAALIMTNDKNLINEKTLEIKGFYSKIITSGKMDMGWNITSTAFKMILTEAIPNLIKNNIREVIDNILKKFDSNIEGINKWAIHPGGKKIVDNFALEMNLERDKLINSYNVLEKYGNMSSPTVLFVLKDLIDTVDFNEKNNIFSCAFGPGITIESMLLSTR